jgi:hypothetical protein
VIILKENTIKCTRKNCNGVLKSFYFVENIQIEETLYEVYQYRCTECKNVMFVETSISN